MDETLRFVRALREMGARRVAIADVRVEFEIYVSPAAAELDAEAAAKRDKAEDELDKYWSAG